MEKHQLFNPISSSSSSSPSTSYFNNSHVHRLKKGAGFLRTPEPSQKVGKEMKQHRFAFQTRTQVDILDDGYRWRKYGEKSVKNNKFPRFLFFFLFNRIFTQIIFIWGVENLSI